MAKYDRDVLLKDLRENVCEVFFTKVNGEKRAMRCSLRPDLLPPNTVIEHLDEMHQKPENLEVIACWDLQSNGWRSFKIDTVDYVQTVDTY